jgi:hypothetical protein
VHSEGNVREPSSTQSNAHPSLHHAASLPQSSMRSAIPPNALYARRRVQLATGTSESHEDAVNLHQLLLKYVIVVIIIQLVVLVKLRFCLLSQTCSVHERSSSLARDHVA